MGGPADKARDLRRMKMLATGLLLGATVVFLLARWGEAVGAPGWVGYVRAMAEALGRDTTASRYSPAIELHPVLGAARGEGAPELMGGWRAGEQPA